MTSTGGCLCGAVRFVSAAEPLDAGYCHCKLCQRSTGATVLAWVSYPAAGFSYTRGDATRFQSSPHGHREFCGTCGTQIAFRDSNNPATVEVNVGCLDDCDRVRPRYHIWCASRVPWFEIADDLPRYERSKPRDADTDINA